VTVGVNIGVERDPKNPKRLIYRTEEVTMIPAAEYAKFSAEYNRALRDKSLIRKSVQDFVEWEAKAETVELERQSAKKKEKEAARAAAAALKNEAPPATEPASADKTTEGKRNSK
jgi:hypothetical protein